MPVTELYPPRGYLSSADAANNADPVVSAAVAAKSGSGSARAEMSKLPPPASSGFCYTAAILLLPSMSHSQSDTASNIELPEQFIKDPKVGDAIRKISDLEQCLKSLIKVSEEPD